MISNKDVNIIFSASSSFLFKMLLHAGVAEAPRRGAKLLWLMLLTYLMQAASQSAILQRWPDLLSSSRQLAASSPTPASSI